VEQEGPLIRPAKPGSGTRSLIPIVPGPGPVTAGRPSGKADPYKFWSDYYRTHDESAAQLRETLRLLNISRKFTDVHAVLMGYLTQRPRNAEPWMYEALAMAIEMIQGKPEDIKVALNYAADLALRTHNPNHLVSAADKLLLKGYYDRVGPLLDEAAAKVPHRAEPLLMSILLAQKTKDPRRMGDSIDRLLSLGWPGNDDFARAEARNQAEKLATTLREEQRGAEADALLARLPEAEARDVFIRLRWDGNADYDMIVQEPLGALAQYDTPRTVFGGSIIKNGYGSHPEEVYVCPRGFDGNYTVRIAMVYTDPKKPTTRLTLETITHEGTAAEKKETRTLQPDDPQAKPVVVQLKGGRRKLVLPFVDPVAELTRPQPGAPAASRATARKNRKPAGASEADPLKATRGEEKQAPPKR
jgi:hypothetical protein